MIVISQASPRKTWKCKRVDLNFLLQALGHQRRLFGSLAPDRIEVEDLFKRQDGDRKEAGRTGSS